MKISVDAILMISIFVSYASSNFLPSSSSFSSTSCTLSILSIQLPSPAMSIPNSASSRGPEFHDPPLFPVSCDVWECAFYLDVSRFTEMRASDPALTLCDRHNVLLDSDVGSLVKRLLPSCGRGLSQLRCIASGVDCPFVRCYGEVKNEKDPSMLVRRSDWQTLPGFAPSLVVSPRPFSHLYFGERFDYWERD